AGLGWNWSAGHDVLVPVHFSSTSHWPAAGRQTVLLGSKASAGQSGPEPVQFSAASQGPVAGRHSKLLGLNASVGQLGEVPLQVSGTSQIPTGARQTKPLGCTASAGQLSLTPSQLSGRSQAPAEARQTAVLLASIGQAPELPVQLSATSHWPAEARQVKLEGRKTSTQVVALVPVQWSAASSSQAAPWEAPVQCVVEGWKTSAGQAPELPVQLSATSHWPAEPRQTVLLDLKTSAQVSLVPVQWSAASSSQAPPCEAPVQCVVKGWKTSAGQPPETPVQLSATSHWPAEARQTVLRDLNTSTQVAAPVPVQWSAASSSQ